MSIETQRFEAIRQKTRECLARAELLYGVSIDPTILFNLNGTTAAWASCKRCAVLRTRQYKLRFNRELILGDKHYEDMLNETVPHEVAHLVCYARPELGRKHDFGWRTVCIALGGNGKTRHSYDVDYASGSYTYLSERGVQIKVSKVRHERIQNGQPYAFKKAGRVTKNSQWVGPGQTLVADPNWTPPTTTTRAAPPTFGLSRQTVWPNGTTATVLTVQQPFIAPMQRITKSEQVRIWISSAKARGMSKDSVINNAVEKLGMTVALAKTYVNGNWDKVW